MSATAMTPTKNKQTARRPVRDRKPAFAPPTAADPLAALLAAAEASATGAAKVWLQMLLKGDAAEVAGRRAA